MDCEIESLRLVRVSPSEVFVTMNLDYTHLLTQYLRSVWSDSSRNGLHAVSCVCVIKGLCRSIKCNMQELDRA
jgi:hypothetical protein